MRLFLRYDPPNMALQNAQLKGFLPSCTWAVWTNMWSFWVKWTIEGFLLFMNYFPLSDRRCVVSIIIWSKVHPKVISVQSISYRVWKPCIFAYMWSFIPCFLVNHMIFRVLFSWKHGIAKSTTKRLFTVIWTKMWFFEQIAQ